MKWREVGGESEGEIEGEVGGESEAAIERARARARARLWCVQKLVCIYQLEAVLFEFFEAVSVFK
jgi:hypothetical protein